jgi:hypothetical protein
MFSPDCPECPVRQTAVGPTRDRIRSDGSARHEAAAIECEDCGGHISKTVRANWSGAEMNARRVTIGVAVVLYVASLLMPAGCVVIKPPFGVIGGPHRPYPGYAAFIITMGQPLGGTWEGLWFFRGVAG